MFFSKKHVFWIILDLAPPPLKWHDIYNPEHQVDMDEVNILAVEPRWFEKGVREAIHIRVEQPSLNKDGVHYNLPSILNNVFSVENPGAAQRTDDQPASWLESS